MADVTVFMVNCLDLIHMIETILIDSSWNIILY